MLREFLYVDISRTRSLIGQLDSGVIESVIERSASGSSSDPLAAIGLSGIWRRDESAEVSQTRSVEDILFVAFEEAVESEGLLRDLRADDPSEWENSSLHGQLEEGEIIRMSADIMLLDPKFVENRTDRFLAVTESLRAMQTQSIEKQLNATRVELESQIDAQIQSLPKDRRKNEERKLKRDLDDKLSAALETGLMASDALDMSEVETVAKVLNAYLTSDAITVRLLPCGRADSSYSFVGSLLERDDYIQRERDALFSRYGSIVSGWTCVFQVAAIPTEEAALDAQSVDFSGVDLVSGGSVDRAEMEGAALSLLAMMDSLGLSEGPRWPAVSIIPLGIYRTVPRSLGNTPSHDGP